jgi:type IV secretion system protein VirB5
MPRENSAQALAAAPGQNPYLNGREEWLERYGNYIKRAAQWRLMAVFCLLLAAGSVAANVIMAAQYKVVPYIVEVDRIGQAAAVSRADLASPAPKRLIQAELANVIMNWRTVTADLDLQKKMVERLSFFMAGSAKGQVRQWYEANNPFDRAKEGKLVQVSIKGLPLPVSQDSWRVEWTETVRGHTGAVLVDPQTFEATLTVQLQPPATDAQVMQNPGGIAITGLSFSRVLSGGSDK